MANIKVSELVEANEFTNNDYTMIIQSNANKKISKANMLNGLASQTEINNLKGQILWTNPNPTSDFSAQAITLSSNDYDVLEFVFELGTTGTSSTMTKILKGTNGNVDQIVNLNSGASQSTGVRHRAIRYSSDTSYIFDDCLVREGGTASIPSVANNYLIPIYVIGYKTGLFN